MASELKNQPVHRERAQRLRAAMGVGGNWRTIDIEGCRIAVGQLPERSQAQPVFCLHDVASGSREFSPISAHPPAGSRLILLDWPGHGRSEDWATPADNGKPGNFTVDCCANLLGEVLARLGLQNPILLGSGFGAAVSIHYAAAHPDRVCGLVLCQPSGLVPRSAFPPPMDRIWNRLFTIGGRRQFKSADLDATSARIRWQSLRVASLRRLLQPAAAAAESSLQHASADLTAKLGRLTCPVLFALSKDSREYPLKRYLSLLDPLLASAPQHRFTIFNGGLHPIWDEPERFSQALASFIQAQLPLKDHRHAWILAAVDWPTEDSNLWKCVHPECPAERMMPSGQNANDPH